MAAPATPTNFIVQKGNGSVYCSWDPQASATSGFVLQRSTDNINFTTVSSPVAGAYDYLDSSVSVGVQYWYQLASNNGTLSAYTSSVSVIPTKQGFMSLAEVRLLAQQRADRVNSNFVTKVEWNNFINQSYHELYDLLVTLYEDYYVASPLTFLTDGRVGGLYPLPDGITVTDAITNQVAQPFFKLLGVDVGLSANGNAWCSLKKFNFISRNRYVFPQITSTALGVFNMRYRVLGSNIEFIPTPAANQYIRMWYIPRLTKMVKDSDVMDGVSGWTEYVIIDAAIKALTKEESDTSTLMMEKAAMQKRIEEAAMNRDAGMPDTISDTRSQTESMGGYSSPFGDGSFGGF